MRSVFKYFLKPFGNCSGVRHDDDLKRIAKEYRKIFRYETLISATKNFDPRLKLGEGGFGSVYKGRLDDGRDIAVKKLSQSSNQGNKEFMNEAQLLAHLQHRNVVKLLGYCAHGMGKLLVYEYVPNESLDKILFNPESHVRELLDWNRRFAIIKGIANGLRYLHEELHDCIIHRDIKASNVLLDEKWIPKLADFGLARLFPQDQTHPHSLVFGTRGYMDPQYIIHGNLSEKTDVYAFGVLVLELVSSQRNSTFSINVDGRTLNLLDWAYTLYQSNRIIELMDPTLEDSKVTEQPTMCIQLGLLCTQGEPERRPSMERVVSILLGQQVPMENPTRPGVCYLDNADPNHSDWWTCQAALPADLTLDSST